MVTGATKALHDSVCSTEVYRLHQLRRPANAFLSRGLNDYHQQYLQKNPGGYCGIGPNGMSCPVGIPGAA